IGAAMAMQEMKLVLATTLSRWRLSLVSDRPLKPVRRGLTIAPPNSFRMVATQRLVTPAAVVGAPR
ncbi:MAG: cytochrome P450, partial [Elainellaceae cyanobacterium]